MDRRWWFCHVVLIYCTWLQTGALGRSLVDLGGVVGGLVAGADMNEEGITFPVYHRQAGAEGGGLILRPERRHLTGSATTNSSTSGDLESKLVTLDKPLGQYYAVLQVGTPAIEAAVIIDSGSELLWLQCEPCVECGVQAVGYPIYDPRQSSSFRTAACRAGLVDGLSCPLGDHSVATGCSSDGLCLYQVTYGDKSTSAGFLSSETLSIPSTKGGSQAKKDIMFGCGINNTGVEAQLNASGLMGLDRGGFSVVTQLNLSTYSYCMPNRVADVHATGYLTFGASTSNGAARKSLQYTPMLQNTASDFLSQFFYLNMTGISVNGALLNIPASAFAIDADGNGGTIIDSGTSLTSFVDDAFTEVAAAFDSYLGLERVDAPNDLVCYKVPKTENRPTPPAVSLHFDGNVDLQLIGDHIFFLGDTDTTNNYYCLAFRKAGSASKNFIGNYQQQDFLVEYDIGNSRIGFASTKCGGGYGNLSNSSTQLTPLISLLLLLFLLL